ncbi:two-component system VirA-like sensor kinase [Rhizobium sp. ZK1]|uniref:two-component system VirA-like sensor kinase n=1 Tax=Rhizobium sp. ZK1 TaxID=3389872 RepID=UPI0039F64B09
MGKSFQGLSLNSFGETLPIALLTLSAIVLAVAAAGRDPGRNVHEAIMLNLRAVDVNHASLQRDVLRARAGLLSSYDPLVSSVVKMRQTTTELKTLFSRPQFTTDLRLQQRVDQLREGVELDEKLVEEFKTRNALLQNSIGVFGQTLSDLHDSRNEAVKVALARVGDLGNLMMRFSTRPDDALQEAIRTRLGQLPEFDTEAPVLQGLGTLIIHARMILAVLPKVDEKIAAIQASGTPLQAEALQSEYLGIAADATSRAAFSRIMLGLTAIILCVYICVLVYRLRAQTKRLKRRLHYEQVVAELKAEMAESDCASFATHMNNALGAISGLFGAEKCAFAICDMERGEIKDDYCLGENDKHRRMLLELARDVLPQKGMPALCDLDTSLRRLSSKRRCFIRSRGAATACLFIGAGVSEGDVAALCLSFAHPQPKAPGDEIRLLQATLQTLIEFVYANRSRQEREGLEHRLEHAQRLEAIGTLAGGIAHEFNNVLSAIQGYGEMAVQLLRRPSTTRHYVQEILRSGARAKHIVDQILTFSRKRERTTKPFDVADAVADVLPLLRVTLGSHVIIESNLDERPAVIEGNPVDVHQLAMNLCKNASQASSRGQKVIISVEVIETTRRRLLSHGEVRPGKHVCLVVQDEGPGIADHVLPHIFEPFFTTNAKTGGSGLGLSAVHGIVSALGGSIDVTSEPGLGSAFRLFLPASDLEPLPIGSFFGENAVPVGNGERVVVVVQDRMLLELYEEKVAALGYEPIGCAGIERLIDQLRAGLCFDIVLIDSKLLAMHADVSSLLTEVTTEKLLLLSDPALDQNSDSPLFAARMLRTPFSSATLANAIFDVLQVPSRPGIQDGPVSPSL